MLMLDLHLYFGGIKCFIGLEESGKTTHKSHSDDFLLAVMAAVCLGETPGVCSGVCGKALFMVYMIALLLFVTEGADHIIYNFFSYISCIG